jgi:serine O-acetyltransferase
MRLVWDIVRLIFVADAFVAQVMYRARMRLIRFRVPILPWLLHRLSMSWCQVCIGKPVVIGPGLYLPHGQVVIDGITNIGNDCIVFPWVTIGLRAANFQGPTIEAGVHIGTGAKVIGPITVGTFAMIGANAVVVDDVPSRATMIGVPARQTPRVQNV